MSTEHITADSPAAKDSSPAPAQAEAPAAGAVVSSLADLVRLREAKGFTASLVSSRLRLAPRQIAAIEAGDWQALPGRTFIRSSLRSYGRLIEADVAPLLDAIEAQLPGGEVLKPDSDLRRPMPREGALGFGGGGSGSRWVWMLLVLVGIIALAFFYGGGPGVLNGNGKVPAVGSAPPNAPGDNAGSSTEARSASGRAGAAAGGGGSAALPASAAPASAAPVSAVPPAPPTPPAAVPSSGPATGVGSSPLVALPAAAPQRETVSAPTLPAAAVGSPSAAAPVTAASQGAGAPPNAPSSPAPAAATPAGATAPATPSIAMPRGPAAGAGSPLNPLVMRFPAESWIEVRDASGSVLITGTQPAGSVREVSGDLPLSLVIGNASGVTVTWRGSPVDVAPHMRLGIARFRIE